MFLGPICQTWLALSRIINLNEKDHHPESWGIPPPLNLPLPTHGSLHSWLKATGLLSFSSCHSRFLSLSPPKSWLLADGTRTATRGGGVEVEGSRQRLQTLEPCLVSVSLSLGMDKSGRGSGKGFACVGKRESDDPQGAGESP